MLLQSHRSRDVSTTIQDMGIKGFAYQAHQSQSQGHTYASTCRTHLGLHHSNNFGVWGPICARFGLPIDIRLQGSLRPQITLFKIPDGGGRHIEFSIFWP